MTVNRKLAKQSNGDFADMPGQKSKGRMTIRRRIRFGESKSIDRANIFNGRVRRHDEAAMEGQLFCANYTTILLARDSVDKVPFSYS